MSMLDDAAVQQFLDEDDGGPVVMLNLLKFVPDGGVAKYRSYIEKLESTGVKERYRVEVVYGGVGSPPLAADGRTWDMVALFRYPSRRNFAEMIVDPDYVKIEHLRAEAVEAAVLQPTTPTL